MFEPIRWRYMVLLAKPEVTYGVDPTLTGANDAILAKNIELRPMEGEDVPRDLIQAYLSGQATIPAGLYITISFDVELAGSGVVGTPPAWGPLLRGAACAEVVDAGVSVTYSPISEDEESLYLKFWLGNTLHAMVGARGTGVPTINAQSIPVVRFTYTGLFIDPVEVARAVASFAAYQKPLIANKVNTPNFKVNTIALTMRNFSLNLGNQVERRLLIPDEQIMIVDRAEALDATVQVTTLTVFDPFALAKAQTRVPVTITHGTVAGNIVTITAPTCQVKRPQAATNSQGVAERPLNFTPLPTDAGNDQFSIVFT